MTKVCTKCKEEKSISFYHKYKRNKKDGRRSDCKSCGKLYRIKKRIEISLRCKEYYLKNKIKIKEYNSNRKDKRNLYRRVRYKNDPIYRLESIIRARITDILKTKKSKRSRDILGIEITNFRNYIEALFKPGMTWENQGQWHIDHIIPLSSAKTEEEIYKLCHYTNLQPLWAAENLSKGAKILPNDQNQKA